MSQISHLKIDSHQHFWQYDPEKHSWITDEMSEIRRNFSPSDLEPLLRKNGFSGCMAVQVEQCEEETVKLLELANTFDFIKGVVGWVDLSAKNVEDRLELYSRDPSFRGIRHIVWDKRGEFMEDPEFQRGITLLEKFGLTYDILAFDYQLSGAVNLVKDFPNQRFVLDHMGKPVISGAPSAEWRKNIFALASHPKVYCKVSGLVTQVKDFEWKGADLQPYLDVIVGAFGVDRLLFGSDWPVCLSSASYGQVVNLVAEYFNDFTEAEREKIFGRNAVDFYNLKLNKAKEDE